MKSKSGAVKSGSSKRIGVKSTKQTTTQPLVRGLSKVCSREKFELYCGSFRSTLWDPSETVQQFFENIPHGGEFLYKIALEYFTFSRFVELSNEASLYPLICILLTGILRSSANAKEYSINMSPRIEHDVDNNDQMEEDEDDMVPGNEEEEKEDDQVVEVVTEESEGQETMEREPSESERYLMMLEDYIASGELKGYVEIIVARELVMQKRKCMLVVEAKKSLNLHSPTDNPGFWQLCAEMKVCADLNGDPTVPVYGVLTSMLHWVLVMRVNGKYQINPNPCALLDGVRCGHGAETILWFLLTACGLGDEFRNSYQIHLKEFQSSVEKRAEDFIHDFESHFSSFHKEQRKAAAESAKEEVKAAKEEAKIAKRQFSFLSLLYHPNTTQNEILTNLNISEEEFRTSIHPILDENAINTWNTLPIS